MQACLSGERIGYLMPCMHWYGARRGRPAFFAGGASCPRARHCPPELSSCSLTLPPAPPLLRCISLLQSAEAAYLTSDEGEGRDRKTLRLQPNQRKLWEVSGPAVLLSLVSGPIHCCSGV